MPFEDETTSASSESPGGYKHEALSNRTIRTSTGKAKDPELSRLHVRQASSLAPKLQTNKQQRRRAQNRQSQKQFRERKQKAYDEVIAQLHDRDQVIAGLRSEITVLNLTVNSLQRGKQNCLDAVVRLCQSMYEFPESVNPGRESSLCPKMSP
jgi:hypothetical protein